MSTKGRLTPRSCSPIHLPSSISGRPGAVPAGPLPRYSKNLPVEYKGRLTVAKVNVDENRKLAGTHGVMSIPTMILFKDGKALDKLIGLVPKERLKELMDKAL